MTTLAILAGGEGRRMGRPKGELRVGGKPILEHLLDRFAWDGPTLLVTAPGRERPPGAGRFDREVVDPVAGEGPLRGVLTAMESALTDTLVVATCDMPQLAAVQLHWILQQLDDRPDVPGVMTCRRTREEDVTEPFPLALRTRALPLIHAKFDSGERSVFRLSREGFAVVAAPREWPVDTWLNLNNPDDLRR